MTVIPRRSDVVMRLPDSELDLASYIRRREARLLKAERRRLQELTDQGRERKVLGWPSVPIFEFRDLPEACGIYVVSDGSRVLYVGQAVNIRQRWASGHHVAIDAIAAGADRIHWHELSWRMLNRAERGIYLAESPPLNTAPPSGRVNRLRRPR